MKPVLIIPLEVMSKEDKAALSANGFCVVEATDPAKVKFLDPIPAALERGKVERAAIGLSRIVLHGQWGDITNQNYIGEAAQLFVSVLDQSEGQSVVTDRDGQAGWPAAHG